jgi:hypothetical protein
MRLATAVLSDTEDVEVMRVVKLGKKRLALSRPSRRKARMMGNTASEEKKVCYISWHILGSYKASELHYYEIISSIDPVHQRSC